YRSTGSEDRHQRPSGDRFGRPRPPRSLRVTTCRAHRRGHGSPRFGGPFAAPPRPDWRALKPALHIPHTRDSVHKNAYALGGKLSFSRKVTKIHGTFFLPFLRVEMIHLRASQLVSR